MMKIRVSTPNTVINIWIEVISKDIAHTELTFFLTFFRTFYFYVF